MTAHPSCKMRRGLALGAALATIAAATAAQAQCVPTVFPSPSATVPVDISFRVPDTARVVTTGNFDGIGGNETGVTTDGFPIIRVDSAVAGTVTVRGNSNSFTYTLPAAGMYAVVFPFPQSGSVTFRVTAATGPFSGGTAVWSSSNPAAPLTVVTAIDDGSEPTVCPPASEGAEGLQEAMRQSMRLSLAEVGTWRQRTSGAVENGRFTWARAFGGSGETPGSWTGVQAGAGVVLPGGSASFFLSYAQSTGTPGTIEARVSHIGGGVTRTFEGANASYVDIVGRLYQTSLDVDTGTATASASGFGYAVSAEVGAREWALGPVVLQPEAQLVVTGADLSDIDLPGVGTTSFDGGAAVYSRFGLAFRPATGGLWARADLWTEHASGTAITFDDGAPTEIDALPGVSWVDLTAGFASAPGARSVFNASVTAQFAEEGTGFGVNALLTIPF